MNVKKRISIFLLTAVLICGIFSGCGKSTDKNDGLKIVTSLFPQYDFARQITDGKADVSLLLTPGSESHSFEPTPKDISKIQQADIFIYIGGESEVWVEEVLKSVKNPELKTLRLMDYIEPIVEEDDGEYDEHIFTSLKNAGVLLDEICGAICSADFENAEFYKDNALKYSEKISGLDKNFSEMIGSAKRRTVVFGDRFPFAYFAADYGLECHAAFTGCGSETEASSATLSSLINIVKKENIPRVFYIEFSSRTIAGKIAAACGVETSQLHSCHNISKEDLENGTSYAELMEQNYKNLSEALN